MVETKDFVLNHINRLAEESERNKDSIYFKHKEFVRDPGFIIVEWDKKQFIVRVEEN